MFFSEIFKANPKLKTVLMNINPKVYSIQIWRKKQELKQLLLEETPWVLDSKNETEQMAKFSRFI